MIVFILVYLGKWMFVFFLISVYLQSSFKPTTSLSNKKLEDMMRNRFILTILIVILSGSLLALTGFGDSEFNVVLDENITAVEDNDLPNPLLVNGLRQNYPNPFNPQTTIEYSLRDDIQISLRIYNLKGQVVKTLFEGIHEAGNFKVVWNGFDNQGREVASGIYFYRLKTDHYDRIHKMLLVK